MRTPGLLLSGLLLSLAAHASADEVVLAGGTRLKGVVLARDDARVQLLLASGQTLTMAAADIREVLVDADAPTGDKVTRYRSGAREPQEGLEVALIHLLHPETGRRVDLVGAVHLGDGAYYREVQRLLEAADVVLYEMVRPKDGLAQDEPAHPIRAFQQQLATWFGMEFQMDAITYDRPHFVHADMTMEQLMEAGRKPGDSPAGAGDAGDEGGGDEGGGAAESGLPGILGGLGDHIARLQQSFGALADDPSPRGARARRSMKRAFAGLLGAMGSRAMSLLGAEASDLLLARRNEIAIQRLNELAPGPTSVAIFYGAAHLPDLEQRLLAQGYRRAGARWLLAWNMREVAAAPPDKPAVEPEPAGAR